MSDNVAPAEADLSIENTARLHASAYSKAVDYYEGLKDAFYDTRYTILERVLRGLPTDTTRILDVGCGIGANLAIMRDVLVRSSVGNVGVFGNHRNSSKIRSSGVSAFCWS